jgi:hypothetical protein
VDACQLILCQLSDFICVLLWGCMFVATYSCPLTTDSDAASCSDDVESGGYHGYALV